MSSGQKSEAIVASTIAELRNKLSVFYFLGDNIGCAPEMRLYECTSSDTRKPDGISKRWCMDFNQAVRHYQDNPTRMNASDAFLLVKRRFEPILNDPTQAEQSNLLKPTMQMGTLRSAAQSQLARKGTLGAGVGRPTVEPLDKDTISAHLRATSAQISREQVQELLRLTHHGLLALGFASAANGLNDNEADTLDLDAPEIIIVEDETPDGDAAAPAVA